METNHTNQVEAIVDDVLTMVYEDVMFDNKSQINKFMVALQEKMTTQLTFLNASLIEGFDED